MHGDPRLRGDDKKKRGNDMQQKSGEGFPLPHILRLIPSIYPSRLFTTSQLTMLQSALR